MAHRTLAGLEHFVELRRKLLLTELEVARAVGRTADAGTIAAELRGLVVSPADALLTRIGIGRAIGGCGTSSKAFESQVQVTKRRLAELDDELREFRSSRSPAGA